MRASLVGPSSGGSAAAGLARFDRAASVLRTPRTTLSSVAASVQRVPGWHLRPARSAGSARSVRSHPSRSTGARTANGGSDADGDPDAPDRSEGCQPEDPRERGDLGRTGSGTSSVDGGSAAYRRASRPDERHHGRRPVGAGKVSRGSGPSSTSCSSCSRPCTIGVGARTFGSLTFRRTSPWPLGGCEAERRTSRADPRSREVVGRSQQRSIARQGRHIGLFASAPCRVVGCGRVPDGSGPVSRAARRQPSPQEARTAEARGAQQASGFDHRSTCAVRTHRNGILGS